MVDNFNRDSVLNGKKLFYTYPLLNIYFARIVPINMLLEIIPKNHLKRNEERRHPVENCTVIPCTGVDINDSRKRPELIIIP